ncbi:MAG TPA: hypothetical protein VGM17_18460 [Rhizomicrobium sp.]|jgi:hypothetical protein
MTHAALLNQIHELAERFRQIADATELPEYADILSATASELEERAVYLETQRVVNPQRVEPHGTSAHARFAICTMQAA